MVAQRLERLVNWLLLNRVSKSEDELYLYLLLVAANTFALIIHVILTVFYAIVGTTELLIYNFVSITIYSIVYVLIRKKYYSLSGFVISIEVMLYTLTASLLNGIDSFVVLYFIVVLVMQFIIPYARLRWRILVSALLWIAMVSSALLGMMFMPAIPLEDYRMPLLMININTVFLGVLLELLIGDWLRAVLANLNRLRMKKLEEEAYVDQLTRLHNRRFADGVFERITSEDEISNWCVAMVDIDDFKLVNDTYGHAVGDLVLVAVADTVRHMLRRSDYVFRWGGEELLILLNDVDVETGRQILDKLRKAISKIRVPYRGEMLSVTVTIGVSKLIAPDIKGGIDSCDQKMYAGKRSGKNCVVV